VMRRPGCHQGGTPGRFRPERWSATKSARQPNNDIVRGSRRSCCTRSRSVETTYEIRKGQRDHYAHQRQRATSDNRGSASWSGSTPAARQYVPYKGTVNPARFVRLLSE
jgi:hypothetical protein